MAASDRDAHPQERHTVPAALLGVQTGREIIRLPLRADEGREQQREPPERVARRLRLRRLGAVALDDVVDGAHARRQPDAQRRRHDQRRVPHDDLGPRRGRVAAELLVHVEVAGPAAAHVELAPGERRRHAHDRDGRRDELATPVFRHGPAEVEECEAALHERDEVFQRAGLVGDRLERRLVEPSHVVHPIWSILSGLSYLVHPTRGFLDTPTSNYEGEM